MKSRIPKIEWDGTKCLTPLVCKICLQICPGQVFRSGHYKLAYQRGKEYDVKEPGRYKVFAEWLDQCTGCNLCIERCPANAITIEFPEMPEKE